MEGFLRERVKGKRVKVKLVLLFAFFAFFAGNLFGQDLEFLAYQIKSGSTESKRDALFRIRNLQTAEASRIAVPALQDLDETVRATAAFSVIYLPSDEAAPILLPLLRDKSVLVRKEAIYALGKTRNLIAVQPLLKVLQTDKELEIKMASIVALGEIGDISAIDSLLKVLQRKLKEEESFLRRTAARAVGQIAQVQQLKSNYVVTPESLLPEKYDTFVNLKHTNLAEKLPVFRQSLQVLPSVLQNQKESDDVRREAAFCLGAIGDESVISNLQKNLSTKDYYLAEISKEALQKISSTK